MPQSKRKRNHNVDDDESPRRYSRRLNTLKEDGTPVRRSARLAKDSNNFKSQTKNSPMKTSARKSLAISITQSARITSRSRKRKVSSSMYDLDYREKTKQKNLLVSPSQLSNQDINETILLSPVELDNEYVISSNPKEREGLLMQISLQTKMLNRTLEHLMKRKGHIFEF